jgi:hypothetical protein
MIVIVSALLIALNAPAIAGKRGADRAALSVTEIEDLVFMREEEKLARDVYAELYRHYKEGGTELLIFANIAASEQAHMEAMLRLLDKYRIDDPAADALPGEFENPVLAALYENLVSASTAVSPVIGEPTSGGKVSVEDALYVGAWIEERDMIDILESIDNTSRADIVGVYTNLLCGSRSHLRAFVRSLGEDHYQPQLLHPAATAGHEVPVSETLEYWLGDASDEICM